MMKIVSLYKNFEILLKEMVYLTFPNVNKRELFLWDNVKSLLNTNGISLGEVSEYQRINEIRIVNNNIKHSGVIDDQTKKQNIPEFDEKEQFDCDSLNAFYARIKDLPTSFLKDLSDKFIVYLFEFDDERINSIANEFKDRMDHQTGMKLIQALQNIYN
jgi:hypothetical protein